MNKRLIILFIIFLLLVTIKVDSFAFTGSYNSNIERCVEANNNGNIRNIEDFICIVGSYEEIVYQIVLDDKFSEVDKNMDNFLFELEKNKDTYFGINKTKNYIDAINDIDIETKKFDKIFTKLCSVDISKEVANYTDGKKVSNKNARYFFNDSDCQRLAGIKVNIFSETAFNILLLNKQQIRADEKKLYDQKQRTKYDNLLNIMMINLGYLERIWMKWPSKLSNPM